MASYSDNYDCVPCGSSTTGLNQNTLDCSCADVNHALVEKDMAGNRLTEKMCLLCPAGSKVITYNTIIAGYQYYADPYSCKSCPDPLMVMSYNSGVYSCSCPSGYTLGEHFKN